MQNSTNGMASVGTCIGYDSKYFTFNIQDPLKTGKVGCLSVMTQMVREISGGVIANTRTRLDGVGYSR